MLAVSRRSSRRGDDPPASTRALRSRTDTSEERTPDVSTPLRSRPAWAALAEHHEKIKDLHLRDLFASDADRGERLTAEAVGLFLDYSKNRITDETLALLFELASQSGLADRIDAMFRGDKINTTENRSVLHVALRMPKGTSLAVDGTDVVAQVHEVL